MFLNGIDEARNATFPSVNLQPYTLRKASMEPEKEPLKRRAIQEGPFCGGSVLVFRSAVLEGTGVMRIARLMFVLVS